ncbi:hypothetical protein C3L33_15913, partial [Rhododendron williamsianum]
TDDGFTINGRVKIPSLGAKGLLLPGKLSNVKVILNGGQRVTFLKPDGYFSFHNVPAGTHLIEVIAIGYFFSPVRVDVSARNPGKVQAALTENRRGLTELVLEPLREEQYYEIREPFNIMSLAKSPMGLMVGFMVIVMFIMPKLVENMGMYSTSSFVLLMFQACLCFLAFSVDLSIVLAAFENPDSFHTLFVVASFSCNANTSFVSVDSDPEEMKRAQEEMRNQGVPSIANLLPGASRG